MNTNNVDKVVYPVYNMVQDQESGSIESDVVVKPRVMLARDPEELTLQSGDTVVSIHSTDQ